MLLQNKSMKPRWRRRKTLFIFNRKKEKQKNKYTKAKEDKTHAEIFKQKHLTKSKINRFDATIKLRLDVVIFQQRIILEEILQINGMGDSFNRGTFGYPYLYRKIIVMVILKL